jgi:serine/threonine protein kinase
MAFVGDGGTSATSVNSGEPEWGHPLGANYLIGSRVAAGATGTVHQGRRRSDGQPVAIKLLRAELGDDPEVVARFVRERDVLTSVDHPHLIRIHDLVIEAGRAAIVMDWVDGGDLRAMLRTSGCPQPSDAVVMFDQILQALSAIHAVGVIHRDVKPANVLIDENGVRLGDFGLSRLVSGSSLTSSSGIVGTVDYLAPELLRGEPACEGSDMYSAGCLFYELLSGRPPFASAIPAGVLQGHLEQDPVRPDGISNDAWALICVLLDKDPECRPDAEAARMYLTGLTPASAEGLIPWQAGPDEGHTRIRGSRTVPDVHGAVSPAPRSAPKGPRRGNEPAAAASMTRAQAYRSSQRVADVEPQDAKRRRRVMPLVLAGLVVLAMAIGAISLVSLLPSHGTKNVADTITGSTPPDGKASGSAAGTKGSSSRGTKAGSGGASAVVGGGGGGGSVVTVPGSDGSGSGSVGSVSGGTGSTTGSGSASSNDKKSGSGSSVGSSSSSGSSGSTGGAGSNSAPLSRPSAPAAPGYFGAQTTSETLTWQAPAGGPAVTGYIVTRDGTDQSGAGTWSSTILPASTRSFPFLSLIPGDLYTLSVVAVNAAGQSGPASVVVRMNDVPPLSAPQSVQVSRDIADSTATITWLPPASPGIKPITGYEVSRDGHDQNGAGAWTAPAVAGQFSYTFKSLIPGAVYTLTVRAVVAGGYGPPTIVTGVQM